MLDLPDYSTTISNQTQKPVTHSHKNTKFPKTLFFPNPKNKKMKFPPKSKTLNNKSQTQMMYDLNKNHKIQLDFR
jgi:hypothetical protein